MAPARRGAAGRSSHDVRRTSSRRIDLQEEEHSNASTVQMDAAQQAEERGVHRRRQAAPSSSSGNGRKSSAKTKHTATAATVSCLLSSVTSEAEIAEFSAEVERQLSHLCCRLLPVLWVRTSRSFLRAEHLLQAGEGNDDVASEASTQHPDTVLPTLMSGEHEHMYRTLRSTIAASATLGHRSCQAVWGPQGSGKHRLLRLVCEECRAQDNVFVMELNGGLLRGDEAALTVVAEQLRHFLCSPQSAALRAADWSIRTGSFDFGQLFRFGSFAEDEMSTSAAPSVGTKRPRGGVEAAAQRRDAAADHQNDGDDEEEDGFITSSTSSVLRGGAASALPALQRTLLLMQSHGVHLLVCIREAEQFGVWCDQLLYVLSGLMHSAGSQGVGGMSLVLSSSAADVRTLEKRLSSRLTCEVRCVPMLPWTAEGLRRAMLMVLRDAARWHRADFHRCEVRLEHVQRCVATRRSSNTEKSEERRWIEMMESCQETAQIAGPSFLSWASLSTPCSRGRECATTCTAAVSDAGSSSRTSLFAHPTLMLRAVEELCDLLLKEQDRQPSTSLPRISTLLQELRAQGSVLHDTGAAASTTLASLSSCLAKAASGSLETAGPDVRCAFVAWLKEHVQRGGSTRRDYLTSVALAAQEGNDVVAAGAALRPLLAQRATFHQRFGSMSLLGRPMHCMRERWLHSLGLPRDTSANNNSVSAAHSLAKSTVVVPEMMDLLEEAKLVRLGYCAKEAFLLIFYSLLHAESGITRSVTDLLEDVSSSLGTRAAAAVDKEAYQLALQQLVQWRLLQLGAADGAGGLVQLNGSVARFRGFCQAVLDRRVECCEEALGLDAREYMRLRSLL